MSEDWTRSNNGSDAEVVEVVVESNGDRVVDVKNPDAFCRYLNRAHRGPVTAGDEWSEFVSNGCGRGATVTVRVVRVVAGTRLGSNTQVVLV